jgi:hypothetical protein
MNNMDWLILFLFIIGHLFQTDATCYQPAKFFIDCGRTRTASAASQFCQDHQMTVVNLTNGSSSLTSDIALLNTTFQAQNCVGYFWFSSGSQTSLVTNVNSLGSLAIALLSDILNLVLCLIPIFCPATTTPAPITNAFTVCTRPVQQHVIQKCSQLIQQQYMQQFRFNTQSMEAGILDSFPARSLMTCSGLCSSNATCVGMSFDNGTCTLYM